MPVSEVATSAHASFREASTEPTSLGGPTLRAIVRGVVGKVVIVAQAGVARLVALA
jgi:hypothetical protein